MLVSSLVSKNLFHHFFIIWVIWIIIGLPWFKSIGLIWYCLGIAVCSVITPSMNLWPITDGCSESSVSVEFLMSSLSFSFICWIELHLDFFLILASSFLTLLTSMLILSSAVNIKVEKCAKEPNLDSLDAVLLDCENVWLVYTSISLTVEILSLLFFNVNNLIFF